MSTFVSIRSSNLLLAGIVLVLLVMQLFSFEDFPMVILQLHIPGGEAMAHVVAVSLVVVELFSLPFLLRMELSPVFRVVSMVFGWIMAVKLLSLTIWETVAHASTSVLFGATVPLPVGWWNVGFMLLICTLVVLTSRTMWPERKF